jgi:broad specificity phosphatase PhoE
MSQMNEINPGVIDGMTIAEIQEAYPEEYERALREPYSHRYPRAESYHDLSIRLEPVILELERGWFSTYATYSRRLTELSPGTQTGETLLLLAMPASCDAC